MKTTTLAPASARLPFGFGLSARPQRDNTARVAPCTAEDAAWWAQASADIEAARELAFLDARAGELECLDMMTAGLGTW